MSGGEEAVGEHGGREASAEGSGMDRFLLRNFEPGARSTQALEGVWGPEQQLGARPVFLGMREARRTRWEARKEGSGWEWWLETFWPVGREGLYSGNRYLLNIWYIPSPGPGWTLL